jgi:very-short-patch-repair endonuclease
VLHERRRAAGRFFDEVCWTPEEDEILATLWPDPKNEISLLMNRLPGRTTRAIKHRLSALRIRRSYRIGKPLTEEQLNILREKLSGSNNHFFGKHHSEDCRRIISEKLKKSSAFHRLNKDPDFQRKRRKGLYAKPNKEELLLNSIIDEVCPGAFNFVGDGQFIVDGLNPDFVHNDAPLIIELFGRSFHDPKKCAWEVPYRSTVSGRRKALAKFGYKMLVVWDEELRKCNRTKLISKIRRFTERPRFKTQG